MLKLCKKVCLINKSSIFWIFESFMPLYLPIEMSSTLLFPYICEALISIFFFLQVLSTRARKGVILSDIKVAVCTYAFDILYIDGQPLLKEQLKVRREVSIFSSMFLLSRTCRWDAFIKLIHSFGYILCENHVKHQLLCYVYLRVCSSQLKVPRPFFVLRCGLSLNFL